MLRAPITLITENKAHPGMTGEALAGRHRPIFIISIGHQHLSYIYLIS